MELTQAMGAPCCKCGAREIIVAPRHLIGACANCSPAVAEERRWNERLAKAATVQSASHREPPRAERPPAYWDNAEPTQPPRKRFGRLPPRAPASPRIAPSRPVAEQLVFVGF